MKWLESRFHVAWYGQSRWTQWLKPFEWLTRIIVKRRRQNFLAGTNVYRAPVPIIVVGNITVGGTGKSPLVIALTEWLIGLGYTPGIVSRGYGAQFTHARVVESTSDTALYGDEPVMLAAKTGCPVVVSVQRSEAVKKLLTVFPKVNVVISDDGLQHYQLGRDIEIIMLDAMRGVGNGHLLPVGPLREPLERLKNVDLVVSVLPSDSVAPLTQLQLDHGVSIYGQRLIADRLINLATGESAPLSLLQQRPYWYVCAGIGNPQRFEHTLIQSGLTPPYQFKWFVDHYVFKSVDIPYVGAVVITEKDAVKCRQLDLVNKDVWYLSVSLALSSDLRALLLARLSVVISEKGSQPKN